MLQKDGIYAMYLRKSRADVEAEARGQFETLAHHLQILTDLADKYEIHVQKIYKEIVSGDSIEGRPEVKKLLQEVSAGVYDGVLVTEVSRLARGRTKDQGIVAEAFRSTGTLIITPSKIYDPSDDADETFFDFELFMARQEYKYIKKRMQRGRELSFQNGNWIFPHVPIGYRKEGLRLVPGEYSDIIRSVMFAYRDGKRTFTETVVFLRAAIPSRKWATNTIRRMLTNPIYAGYLSRSTKIPNAKNLDTSGYIPANCEPLITLQDHVDIIARIAPSPRLKNGTELKNAFAGLVVCQKCGYKMIYNNDHGYPVLMHQSSMDVPRCRCSPISYPVAYKALTEKIIEDLPYMEQDADQKPDPEAIAALRAQLRRAETIKADLFEKLENGLYTASEFRERKILREQEIQGLKRALEGLEEQNKKVETTKVSTDDIKAILRNGSPQEVNSILKILIDRIEYSKPSRKDDPSFTIIYARS